MAIVRHSLIVQAEEEDESPARAGFGVPPDPATRAILPWISNN